MRSRGALQSFDESKAQPVARANVTVCHDPCFRTARASQRRGSSVTFGKSEADGTDFEVAHYSRAVAARCFNGGYSQVHWKGVRDHCDRHTGDSYRRVVDRAFRLFRVPHCSIHLQAAFAGNT
jgi:hypothetical protein